MCHALCCQLLSTLPVFFSRSQKSLLVITAFLNESLASASECLSELDGIELEPTEIPGVEGVIFLLTSVCPYCITFCLDELNGLLNEESSIGVFHYEKELAEQCIARRSDLAAQLCNNTKNSVVRVLLRTAR